MTKATVQKRENLSQLAYQQIKAMILRRELVAGQFINEAQLQEMLGIGRTPVREAVLALAQDNLITVHPRKGIEITRPSPKALHDIFEIRLMLEPLILRQCFETIDLDWTVGMRATLASHQDDTADAVPAAVTLVELDNRFHLELTDTLHNHYASRLMRSLADYLNLIRITTWRPERYHQSNREHIAILDAILTRNADEACRLMESHLQQSYLETVNTMMHGPE